MSKIVLTHGHLIIDGNKEFLDGTIFLDDGKIVDVYPNYKINEEYREIDITGLIVMPKFEGRNAEVFETSGVDSLYKLSKIYDEYTFVNVFEDDDIVKLLLRNIDRRKVMVEGSVEVLKRLKSLNVSYTDMALYTSINFNRKNNKMGIILKGLHTDLLVLDEDMNIVFEIVKGEIKHV